MAMRSRLIRGLLLAALAGAIALAVAFREHLNYYALATFVFLAPGALAYSWLGHAGRAALADSRPAGVTA